MTLKSTFCFVFGGAALLGSQLFAQTITLSGASGSISPGAAFNSAITLSISGANTVGNVNAINALLATPSTGANSGLSFFTVTAVLPASGFDNTNSTSFPTGFGISGDAANNGFSVTGSGSNLVDVGVNTTTPVTIAPGGTSIQIATLTLQAAANTPAGVYNFRFTSGGFADLQGTYINNSSNAAFDVNSTPVFTITVVPEPSTWSLLALSGILCAGVFMFRNRSVST